MARAASWMLLTAVTLLTLAAASSSDPCEEIFAADGGYFMGLFAALSGKCYSATAMPAGMGFCPTDCKQALMALESQGCMDALRADAQDGALGDMEDELDTILQKCNNPTTDDCVNAANYIVLGDCMQADVAMDYCPENCKLALEISPLLEDDECFEISVDKLAVMLKDLVALLDVCGVSKSDESSSSSSGCGNCSNSSNQVLPQSCLPATYGAEEAACSDTECDTTCQVCQDVRVKELLGNGVWEGLVAAAQPCLPSKNCPDDASRAALKRQAYLLGRMALDEYERAVPARGDSWFKNIWKEFGADDNFYYAEAAPSVTPTKQGDLPQDLKVIARNASEDDYQPHVHNGFLSYFLALEPGITKALGKIASADGPKRRLWIVGHSMGGAVSFATAYVYTLYRDRLLTYSDYSWLSRYELSGVFTWGAPQLASVDKNVRQFYSAAASRNFEAACTTFKCLYESAALPSGATLKDITFRFVNENDLVANVPGDDFGYQHVGRYWPMESSGHYVIEEADPVPTTPVKSVKAGDVGSRHRMKNYMRAAFQDMQTSNTVLLQKDLCLQQTYYPKPFAEWQWNLSIETSSSFWGDTDADVLITINCGSSPVTPPDIEFDCGKTTDCFENGNTDVMVLKSDDDSQTYADPDPLSVCKDDNVAIWINYDSSNEWIISHIELVLDHYSDLDTHTVWKFEPCTYGDRTFEGETQLVINMCKRNLPKASPSPSPSSTLSPASSPPPYMCTVNDLSIAFSISGGSFYTVENKACCDDDVFIKSFLDYIMGGWKMFQMFAVDCNFDDPVFEEGIRWQCAASPDELSQLESLFTTGSGSCDLGFLDLLKEAPKACRDLYANMDQLMPGFNAYRVLFDACGIEYETVQLSIDSGSLGNLGDLGDLGNYDVDGLGDMLGNLELDNYGLGG